MNTWTMAFFALAVAGPIGPPGPRHSSALVAEDTLESLESEIATRSKAGELSEADVLGFTQRALGLGKSAKDAAARAELVKLCYGMIPPGPSPQVDKLRGELWDLVIAKDANEGAVVAPLVAPYLKEFARAAELGKKSKSPEIKAACAFVPLSPLIAARERSEKDTKELVAGLNAIKKAYGQVVDPGTKKPWSQICDDVLFQVENLAVGNFAPEIEAADTSGVKFKLSDYRGKVVLLDFWGNW
ncbi:MAG TPA: hypothetical protein VK843_16645 [Planctomycetota bacterium]|nr:hypothetical protein [Planctomycetota bacterium]